MLAVLVTASMGLSVVQAAVPMADLTKMSMPMPQKAVMNQSQDSGCKHCPSDMGGKALACSLIVVCALAADSQDPMGGVFLELLRYSQANVILNGRSLVPEPYPPRPLTFI